MGAAADTRARIASFRDGDGASLLEAALIVAGAGRDGVDEAAVAVELEALAVGAMAAVPSIAPLVVRVGALRAFLCEGCGFGGAAARYYEVDNSLVDRVLATRRGIPITLAVVWVEVGTRIGMGCEGVSFPGHFLVRFVEGGEELLVDPFSGEVLDDAGLLRLLRATQGPAAECRPEQLVGATPLVVLVRMLNNLKQLAMAEQRWFDALRYSELILIAEPDLVFEHGERAVLFEKVGRPDLAVVELQQLEAVVEDGELRARIARELRRLSALGGEGRTLH